MPAVRIKPQDIGPGIKGWISPSGVIYSGDSEFDEHADMADELEVDWSWIRWLTKRNLDGKGTILMFDLDDVPSVEKERNIALCRHIAKQVTHPFDEVIVDGVTKVRMQGPPSYWKGTMDDFIKFGVKGRRKTSFESRLSERLSFI